VVDGRDCRWLGLSRRSSRVRVPSLPFSKPPLRRFIRDRTAPPLPATPSDNSAAVLAAVKRPPSSGEHPPRAGSQRAITTQGGTTMNQASPQPAADFVRLPDCADPLGSGACRGDRSAGCAVRTSGSRAARSSTTGDPALQSPAGESQLRRARERDLVRQQLDPFYSYRDGSRRRGSSRRNYSRYFSGSGCEFWSADTSASAAEDGERQRRDDRRGVRIGGVAAVELTEVLRDDQDREREDDAGRDGRPAGPPGSHLPGSGQRSRRERSSSILLSGG
jgi:hypothetical protein